MVPLAPLAAPSYSASTQTTPLPTELTPEQLAALSTETRQAMEERLRVLDLVQSHIFSSMQYLASALSALPPAPASAPVPTPSTDTDNNHTTDASTNDTTTTSTTSSTSSSQQQQQQQKASSSTSETRLATSTRMEHISEQEDNDEPAPLGSRSSEKGKMRSMDTDG
ncbi:hypothetical protein BCR42DRAFT_421362 [Absidia repens]|uniref:Uncharacterized protein n=1 Tax=Absidia repens TaxID=90262 RepID=A0A1X2I8F5_9FUNG|nr:hypothetical protein BCR42DRAFT_421362 [Absidia repens]